MNQVSGKNITDPSIVSLRGRTEMPNMCWINHSMYSWKAQKAERTPESVWHFALEVFFLTFFRYVIGLAETEIDQASASPTSTSTSVISPTSTSVYVTPPPILDQIAPPEVIRRIIDDWFNIIHSVCPIHHRSSFLQRLAQGNANNDPEFLAVVISLCSATVSSLPRKAAVEYPEVTVRRCFEVVQQNRLLDNYENITLQWCQAKYHLSTSFIIENSIISYRLLGEATTGIKYLAFYGIPNMTRLEAELTKRLYCLVLCGLW